MGDMRHWFGADPKCNGNYLVQTCENHFRVAYWDCRTRRWYASDNRVDAYPGASLHPAAIVAWCEPPPPVDAAETRERLKQVSRAQMLYGAFAKFAGKEG